MPDILVIGSLNADLVVRSPRFPGPGETISGEDLQIIPGGKGANQAVASARQGANVAMVGRVGSDSFGPFLVNNLKTNGVDTSNVFSDDSATGTAIIVVEAGGQNSIVLSPGANAKVSKADVDSAPNAKILLLQFEIPMDIVLHAAKRYKAMGTTVILNPAPAGVIPEQLLTQIDILVPNEIELGLLTNHKVDDTKSAESAAKELLQRGVKVVIVTLGESGALVVTKESTTHVPSFKVNVVDTTAAGDSFIGGFASKLLESDGKLSDMQQHTLMGTRAAALQNAVRYGCACGALAATKFGAQPSLPAREETEALLKR